MKKIFVIVISIGVALLPVMVFYDELQFDVVIFTNEWIKICVSGVILTFILNEFYKYQIKYEDTKGAKNLIIQIKKSILELKDGLNSDISKNEMENIYNKFKQYYSLLNNNTIKNFNISFILESIFIKYDLNSINSLITEFLIKKYSADKKGANQIKKRIENLLDNIQNEIKKGNVCKY